MNDPAETSAVHNKVTVVAEGDMFVAECICGKWRSEGFDTKQEAKETHADHLLLIRLAKHNPNSSNESE